jgi:hypothetical protein
VSPEFIYSFDKLYEKFKQLIVDYGSVKETLNEDTPAWREKAGRTIRLLVSVNNKKSL